MYYTKDYAVRWLTRVTQGDIVNLLASGDNRVHGDLDLGYDCEFEWLVWD